MKTQYIIIVIVGFMSCAAAPPPRETGLQIPTAQSKQILAACIEKRLQDYTEEDLPNGGISVRYGERKTLLIHYQPTLYFDMTDDGTNRNIAIRYRHPMSKGTAAKMLRMVGRKCFPYELDAAGGGRLPDGD